jgi:polyisoprenoid-binding protein YceI
MANLLKNLDRREVAGLAPKCEGIIGDSLAKIQFHQQKTQPNNKKMKPIKFILAAVVSSLGLAAHADTFKIDPVHSSIAFSIQHLGITDFIGRFNDVSGTVVFDKADPSKSSVEISIPVESIDTHNEKRDQHLKSPDFFNAKQFPMIVFKSKSVEASGEDYKVTGELMLHGATKPLTLEIKRVAEGQGMEGETRLGGGTRFKFKRSDFGMDFMQGPLGDEVTVFVSLEGVKQ